MKQWGVSSGNIFLKCSACFYFYLHAFRDSEFPTHDLECTIQKL